MSSVRNNTSFWLQILQAYELEYVGTEEVGMLNRVFTMPDKPVQIKLTARRPPVATAMNEQ